MITGLTTGQCYFENADIWSQQYSNEIILCPLCTFPFQQTGFPFPSIHIRP